jgi:hypothetical protein
MHQFTTGQRVRVKLPDNAKRPEDPSEFEGVVQQAHAACMVSGLPGILVNDGVMVHHLDPEWVFPL